MKRILFIDRDGTLIKESPPTYQIDDFSKLEFYPGCLNSWAELPVKWIMNWSWLPIRTDLGTEFSGK